MRENLSKQLFQVLHECEKATMPFLVTSDLNTLVGKKLLKVYTPSYGFSRLCEIFVFEGDAALWVDKHMNYLPCISLVNSYWFDKTGGCEAHADAFITDECRALMDLGLITENQTEILLEMAKQAREQQHKEELEREINSKREQLEELENELKNIVS